MHNAVSSLNENWKTKNKKKTQLTKKRILAVCVYAAAIFIERGEYV